MGISVITPTIREENINNIIENYSRQNCGNKELIIVLNYCNPNIRRWEARISNYDNIEIAIKNSKYSLGQCLNQAISKSKFDFIARFDDDDYYGPDYLNESIYQLKNKKADIIGKSCIYIYFKDKRALRLHNKSKENRFVNRVCGSTLFFRKDIIDKIKFQNLNLSEDRLFCKDVRDNGLSIYSTSKQNYIYIRSSIQKHSWRIHNDYLYNASSRIAESINLEELINGSIINSQSYNISE